MPPPREVRARLVHTPADIRVGRPFLATVRLENQTAGPLGPLSLSLLPRRAPKLGSGAQPPPVAPGFQPFALEGEQEVALAQALAPGSSRQVSLSLVALEPGQSCLPPVHVHDERTGALLDSTLPWDVWVLPP